MKSQASFWGSRAEQINFVNPCIIEELSKYVEKNSLILEYGCGYGRILADLSAHGYTNLHGVDFSEEMLQRGHKQFPELDLQLNDGYKIPFPDESVDAVLLFTVLKPIMPPCSAKSLQLFFVKWTCHKSSVYAS